MSGRINSEGRIITRMPQADLQSRITSLRNHFDRLIPKHALTRLAMLIDVGDIKWWTSDIQNVGDDRVSGRLVVLTDRSIVLLTLKKSSVSRYEDVSTAVVESARLTDLLGVNTARTDMIWSYPSLQAGSVELRFGHRDPVALPLTDESYDTMFGVLHKYL